MKTSIEVTNYQRVIVRLERLRYNGTEQSDAIIIAIAHMNWQQNNVQRQKKVIAELMAKLKGDK